jgi:hypothetical protein
MLQPLGKLNLLIYTEIQSFMTYLWFNGLLKGKTANFLTRQSDLSKKPTKKTTCGYDTIIYDVFMI